MPINETFPEPRSLPAPSFPRTIANGRYVLVRRLAEGGTATVHLGYDTITRQWRAIKTLLPDFSKRPALRHRFELEGRTMSELEHPNVVRVYEAGQEGDTAWLVMEFAEGGSVIDWVERHGRMPPKLACHLILGLCDGIQYAHERGVVHRDIKPQNALVDIHGTCKVADFGIAQVTQETRMTMTGTVMGTIGYMAPEQHESAKHADHRADVYSIAATLYTLMAGEAPTHLFMADDGDFEAFPPAIAAIVRKGSQYRREARYQSVAEMAAALREALATLPEDPPGTPEIVPPNALKLDQLTPPTTSSIHSGSGRDELVPSNAAPIVTVPPPIVRSEEPPAAIAKEVSQPLSRRSLTGDTAPRLLEQDRDRFRREALFERAQRLRRLGGILAMVLAVAIAFGAGTVALGAWHVGQWEKLELNAEDNVYRQIHQERTLLDVLGPLDVPQFDELRQLFDEVDQGDADQREAASLRLVSTLEQVRRTLETRNSTRDEHAVKQLAESIRRLQECLGEQQRIEKHTEEIRNGFSGWVATKLGF